MITGCYTAIVTPFTEERGEKIDEAGLDLLIDFQIANGISGIVAVGSTGESSTLNWKEHNLVIEKIAKKTQNKCITIAGVGSNSTKETLEATKHAYSVGATAMLLVDPYYNGPSSLEIRKEYVEPVAKAFPDVQIIPYIIPGRTGTQLLPEDLAIIHKEYKNVSSVKEATGDITNMRKTRTFCGDNFSILSGDDPLTYEMMTDPQIKASGIISVTSNIFPYAVTRMVKLANEGNFKDAQKLNSILSPIFNLVTVKTKEATPFGDVVCRARNPLAIKTIMSILGMPSGPCRQPLGKMTLNGFNVVFEALQTIFKTSPDLFKPISDFFGINISRRLENRDDFKALYYTK
ncbi:MAG: 4-hydroxy-tetrahydrodipicolinate synthase [Desulfobacterales bacterium]|nr:4-hydroxy-tetrahydrodipicolinate synthase [Desulfobacterales bacterium]